MKVALVCPYDLALPGGVQQQVLELERRIRSDGDEARVVGPGVPGWNADADPWVSVGTSVSLRGNASRVPVTLEPSAWRSVREAVEDMDVVHVHEPLMPLASLAALWCGRPVVATFHAAPPTWVRVLYRTLGPVLHRPLGRTIVTAVSPVAASALPPAWGVPRLIPNGIDTGSFDLAVEPAPRQVLFVGRDEPRKGLDVLLAAWPHVRSAFPEARLVVAGSRRASTDPTIRFEGRVSEMRKRELLGESGVFVAPHTGGESFGIVIAEAMAAGCAVVASDLGAFRSVAGESAHFFDSGSPSALASSLVEILTDDAGATELGQRARERVRAFDWDTVLGAYQSAYRAAIDAG